MNNVLLLIWNVNISGFKILHLTFVMWKNCHAYVSWLYTVGADQQLQHVVCILFKQRFYRRVFMTAYRPFTCIENKYKNDQFKMVLIERKLYLYSGLLLIITIFFFFKNPHVCMCVFIVTVLDVTVVLIMTLHWSTSSYKLPWRSCSILVIIFSTQSKDFTALIRWKSTKAQSSMYSMTLTFISVLLRKKLTCALTITVPYSKN